MFAKSQKERYDQAVEVYVARISQEPHVIGVVVSGSYVHGQLGPHSDVDVFVITHPDTPHRERGNTWIEGVEMEYFQNPPQQIRAYFQRETYRPVSAHLLANGIVRYDVHPEVQAILQEAKAIVEAQAPAWNHIQIEFARYGLDDLRKDLLDCLANEDAVSGRLLVFQLMEECVRIYFGIRREWGEKKKRLLAHLKVHDPAFAALLESAIVAGRFEEQVQASIRLVEHVEGLLGGRRPEEWKLRSALDC